MYNAIVQSIELSSYDKKLMFIFCQNKINAFLKLKKIF
jgi:hypothetical protein